MKKSRLTLLLLFGILCGITALGITVYPLVGNYYSSKNKSTVLTEYTATVNDLEDGNISEMLAAAHAYNESLTPGVISIESVFTQAGQDLCTLVTCTPFGVNTHRLLVRGHRIPYTEASNEVLMNTENEAAPVASTWQRQYIKGLTIALGLLALGMVFARMTPWGWSLPA